MTDNLPLTDNKTPLSDSIKGTLRGAKPEKLNKKKAFDWTFERPGEDAVKVVVYFYGQKDGELSFLAESSALSKAISNPNIQELHSQVEAALHENSVNSSNVDWEDWLKVEVTGSDETGKDHKFFRGNSASLCVRVHPIPRGVHRITGKVLTLTTQGIAVPFPEAQNIHTPSLFQGKPLGSAYGTTYLKDTPEVKALLLDVIARMGDLRTRLADAIAKDLPALIALLPAPDA